MTPGQLIKSYRIKKGMTQLELAKKLGYEIPQFISLIENGHSKVPLNVMGELIIILEIPVAKAIKVMTDDYVKEIKKGLK